MRQLFLVAMLCWFASLSVRAQVILQPGDSRIHPEWVKPSHDFYRTIVLDSAGRLRYDFVMDNYTIIDSVAGQITLARSRQVPPGRFSTDTSVTDLSLRPLRM